MSEEVKLTHQKFAGDVSDDVAIERHTQQIRITVADGIMSKPAAALDKDEINSLNKMLSGIDAQVTNRRRIAAQDKSAEKMGDLANAINQVLTERLGAKIQRHDDDEAVEGDWSPVIPEIPSVTHIDGELSSVGETIDVEEIMANEFDKVKQAVAE
ncbi:hypothetical protein PHOBOS_209 [Erwinia phage vB_EamM_Phobos]|uniref:hypothetical protein n=1 Tax=Erwinia phage vB_EamM_Phobos TaxID=1883377 RepID=UPI00081CF580|nr:hypothetical protein BIZ79_gp209 [Erwinia phage vB_EamM_Phobos]ANZ50399.1 hypothetical protein PHOBOS_209 [Erwinia phage vB_EamM_Phobos]